MEAWPLLILNFTLGHLCSGPCSPGSTLTLLFTLQSNIVQPCALQDVLFCNISKKQCQLHLGPIISHLVLVWRLVKKHCHLSWKKKLCKWHNFSPIFNNKALLIGRRPICAPQWEQRGVHYLKVIYNDFGLLSFADVKDAFDLPGSTFFFYLQLRSALRAQGVPWQCSLPTHPLRDLFTEQNRAKGMLNMLNCTVSCR